MRIRTYPIRLNKRKWKILFHSIHRCSLICSIIYFVSEQGIIAYNNIDYINGQCLLSNEIVPSNIKICDLSLYPDVSNLLKPNEIVIPDNEINIKIEFPLNHPTIIHRKFDTKNGITRIQILNEIYKIYKKIYDDEELTSTESEYKIIKKCYECSYIDLENDIKDCVTTNEDDVCSICYERNKNAILNCSHTFHRACLYNWLNEDKNTCPLCRTRINNCTKCNNTGYYEQSHNAVVIPYEHRNQMFSRNTTNGLYGIFKYDLENLTINSMYYDREHKLLQLIICPDF